MTLVRFYITFCIVLFLAACTGDPVVSEFTNPIDEDNEEYTLPEISDITGLGPELVLSNNSFALTWTGSSPDLLYWVSLTGSALEGYQEGVWIPLGESTSFFADYLNEGPHRVRLKAKYTADHADVFVDSLDFAVDALAANSLWLFPTRVLVEPEQTFSIYVNTDEWDQDFRAGSIFLSFETSALSFDAASLEMAGTSSFLDINTDLLAQGIVQIDFNILTSEAMNLSGTVSLLKLDFTTSATFQQTNIELSGQSILRTMENQDAPITNLISSGSYSMVVEKALDE